MQLQAEDENTRIKAVQILGSLYGSPHASYATTELPTKYIQEYLNRFIDVSKHVRLKLIEQACLIMKSKSQCTELVGRIEGNVYMYMYMCVYVSILYIYILYIWGLGMHIYVYVYDYIIVAVYLGTTN